MYGSSRSLIEPKELEKVSPYYPGGVTALPTGEYIMPLSDGQTYGLWTGPCTLSVQIFKDKSISVGLLTK